MSRFKKTPFFLTAMGLYDPKQHFESGQYELQVV